MKRMLTIGLLLLAGLTGCEDKRAEQAKALETELRANLVALAPAGEAPGLVFETLTLTPAEKEADGFRGKIAGIELAVGDGSRIPIGEVGFTLKPEGDDLRHYSDFALPATIAAKLKDGTEFSLKLAGVGGTATWSNAFQNWTAADIDGGRLDFAVPAEKVTASAERFAYTLATKPGAEGRVDQTSSLTASGIVFDSPEAAGTIASLRIDADVTGAKMADLVALNADYRKAVGAKDMKALGEVLGKMAHAIGAFEVRFAAEKVDQTDVASQEHLVVGRSGFSFGMAGLDGAQSTVRAAVDYDGLALAEAADPTDDMAMLVPTGIRLKLGFEKVPTEKLIQLAGDAAAASGGETTEGLQLAAMMFVAGIQGALAEAGTELHIADSLVRMPESETAIAGLVMMDPQALMGATGKLEFEVAGFDKLSARLESLIGPEFANWLRDVAVEKPKDGATRAAFEVMLAPDGSITVNGQPLPQ